VTINGAILALDKMIEEGREDPDPEYVPDPVIA
jgi:hypothetical protein